MYEEQIANIYRKCEVTHFPIDCFSVMERMGFCVKSFTELLSENPELTFLRNNSTDALTITNSKETFYNDRKSRKRIRFTLMHELGHYVLKTKSETAADTFASEILAPVCIVRQRRLRTADEVCVHFDVSVSCANMVIARRNHSLQNPFDSLIVNYFTEVHQKRSERLSVRQEGKYKRYELADRKLRENHTEIEYWNIVLDRLENERYGTDY